MKNYNSLKFSFHLANLFPLFVWGSILLSWVGVVLNRLVGLPIKFFVSIVLVFTFFIGNKRMKSKVKATDLLLFIVIASFFLILWASNADNFVGFEKDVPNFLCFVLPYFFAGLVLNQTENSKSFWWISIMTLIVEILYIVVYTNSRVDIDTDYDSKMSIAFSLLPHVAYLFMFSMRKHGFLYLLPALLGLVFLLSLGNRGSVIQVIAFILLSLFFLKDSKRKFHTFLFAIFFVLIYVNLDSILLILQRLFDNLGLSVRVINFLLSDDFVAGGSGRDYLWTKLWVEIQHHPLIGQGLYADRAIIHTYSHNFIIEFLVSFGIPVTILILLLLFILFLRAFRAHVSREEKRFLLILICSGFGVCLTSGSVWHSSYVFMSIGYAITLIREGSYYYNVGHRQNHNSL